MSAGLGPAIRLGVRLTGVNARPARVRTGLVALATAIGTALLLGVMGAARSEALIGPALYGGGEMRLLLAAVILAIAMPVLVLAATAARLSADLRDRRLANLRLLGLTPAQTRWVSVAETGTAAALGVGAGWLSFWPLRSFAAGLDPAHRQWTVASLTPTVLDQALVALGLLAAVIAVAAVPQRQSLPDALDRARRADARRPSPLRLLPLGLGLVLCTVVVIAEPGPSTEMPLVIAFFAGVTLLGLGTVAAVPVLVRILADGLLRGSPGPTRTTAARRLQAQPAGVTRVVAGLLIGLFLVTGARAVVVAFEETPQYRQAARQLEDGQRVAITAPAAESDELALAARDVAGVREVATLPRLAAGSGCLDGGGICVTAIVGTCDQLATVAPGLRGCRDGQPLWFSGWDKEQAQGANNLAWRAQRGDQSIGPALAITDNPAAVVRGDAWQELEPVQAQMLLPPSVLHGIDLPDQATVDVLVLGEPGRGLWERLTAVELIGRHGGSVWTFEDYDFVAGLRALVWSVAAVILGVGLLAFAVAAIDRAVQRRREVVALQLAGVSRGMLRRMQWLEAALPIGAGMVLAIGLGLAAGASYLSLAEEVGGLPWAQALTLGVISSVAAVVIAGVTVIAASPAIRADLIRTE